MTLEIKQEAMNEAYQLIVYEESEQSDLKDLDNKFDALWQSIYDVCKLVRFGIIDDISEIELQEGLKWLKKYQMYTDSYQDLMLDI